MTTGVAEAWSADRSSEGAKGIPTSPSTLLPGNVLGDRYEIVQLLGEGGMGAVYKAKDRELERLVALKVIRPDLANRQEILQRFKQELILARKVTHKNVIRIYDLGEADRVKFISMDYIDGQDLKTLLKQKGKLGPEEVVSIISQVCRALNAAHAEGVIHRDLKPQNIMVDLQDKVTVMDFGIARSMETPGLTQTGAVLGTPEYMSPEQAKGEEAGAQSDLFALGIIAYELLTGKTPYRAETALASMLKRIQERARPPVELDDTIPRSLSDVVVRCLEVDLEQRYRSATEILQDLGVRQKPRDGDAAVRPPRLRLPTLAPKWIIAAFAVLVLAIAGLVYRQKILSRPAPNQKPAGQAISLAILPFRNASGDPTLDWLGSSVAEMLSTDMGQSSYLRTVSPDRLHQILNDLRITPNSSFDPPTLRRVADFTNADRLVWGQYLKFGDQIRIDATLEDLKREHTTALKAEAPNEKELLRAIDQLAQSIQQNLELSSDILKELRSTSLKPSSKSIQALRYYNEGLQLTREGKNLEAQKKFEASTREDPEFALAYSRLAQTYTALGYDNQAETFSRKAVGLSEKLPPQEKYLILANHARILNDNRKAIESYENLAKVSPEDRDVQFTLAGLYETAGSFDRAREHYTKVLALDPKYVDALLGISRVEIRSGTAQASLEYLNRGLTLAIQLGNEEEKADILHVMGVAYKQLNQPSEALRNYQESLAIRRRIGQKRGIAVSLNEIAKIQVRLGNSGQGLKDFQEALSLRREIGDKKGIGDTLIDLGNFYNDRDQHDQALKLYKESLQIQRDIGNENYQALCLNNIGNAYLSTGDYGNARTYFEQALQLREKFKAPDAMAITVHNLAETSTKMGQYDQALTQYLRALELRRSASDKRGAAIESYSIGTLFEYQGRYGAAVKSKEEALKAFRELHDRSFWMAEILSGYGSALVQAGRGEEAEKSLNEALSLARELKNQTLVAQTLNFRANNLFYRGELKSARPLYEQALQTALGTKDRNLVLVSKLNLARMAIQEGHSAAAVSSLKSLGREAEALGLKYLAVECSIYLGEALLNIKDYSHAQQELEGALGSSEKLGLRTLLANAHYLLATTLRLRGQRTEPTRHYEEARRILEEIRKEAGSDDVLKRGDLNTIYTQSKRWAQGA